MVTDCVTSNVTVNTEYWQINKTWQCNGYWLRNVKCYGEHGILTDK
jgi:hypothetical protein